jgi:hypothetical protein
MVTLSLLEEEPEEKLVAEFHKNAAEWLTYVRELQAKHQHKQQYLSCLLSLVQALMLTL